jgi:heme/copper-type cytochrome/quinol oxidase subunit 3
MQYVEYAESAFSISDGVYGSTFFVRTGFHGFHVIVGATYLTYVLVLMARGILTYNHHFSFEAAAWY